MTLSFVSSTIHFLYDPVFAHNRASIVPYTIQYTQHQQYHYTSCIHIVLSLLTICYTILCYVLLCYAILLIIYLLCYTSYAIICHVILLFFIEHPDRRRSERRLFLPQPNKDVRPLYPPGQRL